jgi:SAM-dependent methyltransferase
MRETDRRVKQFYAQYRDAITEKRACSPYWLRRYAHSAIHDRTLRHVKPGLRVVDAGCGEGVLSILMAERGASVTGVDLSKGNLEEARRRSRARGLDVRFIVGDCENLPLADSSSDLVVSSHVIEHLPDPMRGLRELRRVSRDRAIIVMPTCLNPASLALLGRDVYWKLTRRSVVSLWLGGLKTLGALMLGRDGVQEGYAGADGLPHVWRFPWVVLRMVRQAGFRIHEVEAGPLIAPWATEYLPALRRVQVGLDRMARAPVMKYFGLGTHVVAHK